MKKEDLQKPLEVVQDMLNYIGLEPTYAHEDLIFVEQNNFLIRLSLEDPDVLYLHFNKKCDPAEAKLIKQNLRIVAVRDGVKLMQDNTFSIVPNSDKSGFEVSFMAS
nr:hypothetical protein [uncultured Carboxylicivirga sp.]